MSTLYIYEIGPVVSLIASNFYLTAISHGKGRQTVEQNNQDPSRQEDESK